MLIKDLGYDAHFERAFRDVAEGHEPARVSFASRELFKVHTENGEHPATLAGKLRHAARHVTVGDWVALRGDGAGAPLLIDHLLPRKNLVARGAAGARKREGGAGREVQPLCANVDSLLIVCGLDRDYNLGRIERYAALAYASAAVPVVVLTKVDLSPEGEPRAGEVRASLPGVEVLPLSARTGENFAPLREMLSPGRTAALVGSSGAGKSTILNRLLRVERARTSHLSAATAKGRHTTTHRELFALPGGGVIIDNPGLREIALTGAGEGGEFSARIDELAKGCRFRDCTHEGEPGCAVARAVREGVLDRERLASYRKLQKERHHVEKRTSIGAAGAEREKWKAISKIQRKL